MSVILAEFDRLRNKPEMRPYVVVNPYVLNVKKGSNNSN